MSSQENHYSKTQWILFLKRSKIEILTKIFKKQISKVVGVSALKYSILKSSLGSDIVYHFEKSISFEGDSGPYLQYGSVRAKSIIEKSKGFNLNDKKEIPNEVFDIKRVI